ncbi:MAG: reverse transcriptase domain-containing protein [Nitrososphaera sp.]|nr:reverse transcriptase domain-containing protein [Nitrososphaera sp.]
MILDKLRLARYISTIDLSQAYFQIPLTKESREITAFIVPTKGLFHFTRMPYGLTKAPATFQRLLDRLIGPAMDPYAFAYLDDIIIATRTFEEHLHRLRRVLRTIYQAGLTINPEKCKFCCSEVKYLGFVVNQDGLQVNPDKVTPVVNYPVPKTVKQVRRFLGMASWYRRFIPNFASATEPLNRLLRKNQPWIWEEEQADAFNEIRRRPSTAPTLACPDFSLKFVLQTDASIVGLGAILTQSPGDVEHVIAYASRTLTDAECKYSVTKLECLAVIWSIQKFGPYIKGYHFTVITHHNSLRWLHNQKNPAGRLARWSLELLGTTST